MTEEASFFRRYWWLFAGALASVTLAGALNISNTDNWLVITNSTGEDWVINFNTTKPVVCLSGNYSYWNGSGFYCSPDQGGSGGDGNNYTTSIGFTGTTIKTLTLTRNGMTDLTAQFTDLFQNFTTEINWLNATKAATGSIDCGSGNFLRVLTISNDSWTTTCAADSTGSSNAAYQVSTDFIGIGTTSFPPYLGAATSSGTSSNPAPQYGYPGIVYLRDSTTANGGYRYTTGTTDAYFLGNETFRMIFRVPATSGNRTTLIGYYGFHDATSITQPTDGCYFRQVAQVLRGECRNNAGPTLTATNYTVTADAWYDGRITVNAGATSVLFEIYDAGGSLAWNSTVAANIPNTSVRVFGSGIAAYESSVDAAADIIWVDYMKSSYNNAVTVTR